MTETLRIDPLGESHFEAWADLFAASGCACFCRFWHFEGDKNAWLERCAVDSDANRREQRELVRAGSPEARGLVALRGESAVGWLKISPRSVLAKLRRRGPYRALDLGEDDGVWSLGCLLVHPAERRRGVARALVAAAEGVVAQWSGRLIEAYPHRAMHPLHDEEAWMGPERLFLSLGYAAFHDEPPYPVYRKSLAVGPNDNRVP